MPVKNGKNDIFYIMGILPKKINKSVLLPFCLLFSSILFKGNTCTAASLEKSFRIWKEEMKGINPLYDSLFIKCHLLAYVTTVSWEDTTICLFIYLIPAPPCLGTLKLLKDLLNE